MVQSHWARFVNELSGVDSKAFKFVFLYSLLSFECPMSLYVCQFIVDYFTMAS